MDNWDADTVTQHDADAVGVPLMSQTPSMKDIRSNAREKRYRNMTSTSTKSNTGTHGILSVIMSIALILLTMPAATSTYAYAAEWSGAQCSDGITSACSMGRTENATQTDAMSDDDNVTYSIEDTRVRYRRAANATAHYVADDVAIAHQMVTDGQPTIRQADDSGSGSYMTNLDLTNLAQKDNDTSDSSGGGSNFVQNALKAMQQIVNTVLLPIGLVVVVARLMYIAVFPLMIGIDPFDVIDTDSFREGPQSVMRRTTRGGNGDGSKDPTFGVREYDWGGKGDWRVKLTQEQIEYIMKQELIGSGKVLLMIIVVWGVINLAIWLAGTVLGYFHI